ncbi:hypothetical protein COOONC_16077 [Cooperia oncophora]
MRDVEELGSMSETKLQNRNVGTRVDYHIGVNLSEERRVARVTLPTFSEMISEVWHDPRVARIVRTFYHADEPCSEHPEGKAMQNMPWIEVSDNCTINSPEQHALEQAAATGIGNARSGLLIQPGQSHSHMMHLHLS